MTAASACRRSTASKTSFDVAHGSTVARGSMRRSASWLKAPRSPWIATFIVRIVCQQQLRFSSSRCTREAAAPDSCSSPRFVATRARYDAPHYRAIQQGAKSEGRMLWTLFVILLVLWLAGVVSSYTLGGFIHLLLVLAVLALVFQLISDRRTSTV